MIKINLELLKCNKFNEAKTSSVKKIDYKILLKIFEYLDEENLMMLSLVSWKWKFLSEKEFQNKPKNYLLQEKTVFLKCKYPKIGRLLTQSDIGKKVFRTRPEIRGILLDWDYVADGSRPIDFTLISIDFNCDLLVRSNQNNNVNSNKNDGEWVTENEFFEHVKSSDIDSLENPYKKNQIKLYCYPGIGRNLTEADIGKQVFRTHPDLVGNWSLMQGETRSVDLTLTGFSKKSGYLLLKGNQDFGAEDNDGCWITAEEFEKHKESPDFKVIEKKVAKCDSQHSVDRDISHIRIAQNQREYYPNIGRLLTVNDIGEKVVRTRPSLVGDWSNIPREGDMLNTVLTHIDNKDETLTLKIIPFLRFFKKYYRNTSVNDGSWVTKEEFIAHTKSPHFEKCECRA